MTAYQPTRIYDYDAILEYIINFKREHDGNSPTIREVAEQFNISSTNTVHYILKQLAAEGKIILGNGGLSRMISIPGGQWSVT